MRRAAAVCYALTRKARQHCMPLYPFCRFDFSLHAYMSWHRARDLLGSGYGVSLCAAELYANMSQHEA
jgi:hypothetical protein